MRDLQMELRARAEACRFASQNALTPEQRELFEILAVLWSVLAEDCLAYGHCHVADEIQEVSALHAEALARLRSTLH